MGFGKYVVGLTWRRRAHRAAAPWSVQFMHQHCVIHSKQLRQVKTFNRAIPNAFCLLLNQAGTVTPSHARLFVRSLPQRFPRALSKRVPSSPPGCLRAPRHAPRSLTARCPAPHHISVRFLALSYVSSHASISFMMWMRHLIVMMVLVHPNATLCVPPAPLHSACFFSTCPTNVT